MDDDAKREITARVIRPGDPPIDDEVVAKMTPEERMDLVWELTLACMAWQKDFAGEPRLQRSVVRIQRPSG